MIDPEQIASLGPDWVAQQKAQLGLNKPLPVRYGLWLKQVAQGNLGFSYNDRQPITGKIRERIWPTMKLMLTVELLALVVAVPLGVHLGGQAVLVDRLLRDGLRVHADLDPVILPRTGGDLHLFASRCAGCRRPAWRRSVNPPSFVDSLEAPDAAGDWCSGLAQAAPLIRYTRSSMLETIRQDYVRTARAKGLSERVVIYRHALRNALIPLVTVVALDLPKLLGGTVIIEAVFAWPGMGTLAIEPCRRATIRSSWRST